jgi:hypothetical protein
MKALRRLIEPCTSPQWKRPLGYEKRQTAQGLLRLDPHSHDRMRSTILVEERPSTNGNSATRPPRALITSPPTT